MIIRAASVLRKAGFSLFSPLKKIWPCFFSALLIGVLACAEQPVSPLVAKVGEREIGIEEFKVQAAFMGLGCDPSQLSGDLRAAVLETLIRRHLVLAEASSRGIRLLPEELEREEKTIRKGLRDEDFESALVVQGLDYHQWRNILAQELLMRKTLDLVLTGRIRVTATEVQAYYQTHRKQFDHPAQILAQHIVLPSRKLALELLRRVGAGEDLGKTAADLGFPLVQGGEPTWLSRGHMPESLEDKIFFLRPGKLAGPLSSTYGFHVLKVLAKRPAGLLEIARVAPEIQQKLSAQKKETLARSWMEALRRQVHVWVDPGFKDGGKKENTGS